ncbi:hypothetical protein PSTEL_08535 [Paenibacillus stellifer]|uniref:Uncharacterized protein n=1 Tax=Paenibacillus stellifer TaxID=169760 RepID=A0A089LQF4_9BACL|nr:hypothetical protein PSTEL_08535 [Paenibacillus stellifer]
MGNHNLSLQQGLQSRPKLDECRLTAHHGRGNPVNGDISAVKRTLRIDQPVVLSNDLSFVDLDESQCASAGSARIGGLEIDSCKIHVYPLVSQI